MKRLLGNLAVLGLMMLAISAARPALAFEFDIGGERKANLNGFYEMRLLFLGEDIPSNGVTFSQFLPEHDVPDRSAGPPVYY